MRTILMATMLVLGSGTLALAQNTTGSLPGTAATPSTTTTGGTTASTPGTQATNDTTTTTATPGAVLPAARDAAIVMCGQDFTTGAGALLVFSASVSANGPATTPGAPCAQALADLFAAGFSVIDVQPFNQQLQYTLVR